MIADYLTKPLQGYQFEMFRKLIMGWKSIKDILTEIRQSAKEHVVNRNVTEKPKSDNDKNKMTFKEALMGVKNIGS